MSTITMIVPYTSEPRYGVSVASRGLLQGLKKIDEYLIENDIKVHVFSYKEPVSGYLGGSELKPLESFGELLSSIKKSQIIHVPLVAYFPVAYLPYFKSKKVLFHVYGLFHRAVRYMPKGLRRMKYGFYTVFLKFFSRGRNQEYICVSRRVKEEMFHYYGLERDRLHVVENPVLDEFFSVKKQREEGVILSVGYVDKTKNQELAIRSLKRVIDSGINASLVIVGGVSDKDYYKKLKMLIRKLDLEKHVKFLGYVPFKRILALYSRADITLITSKRETFSLALAESMATGTPVVSTPVGVAPDVIENERTGFLVGYDYEEVASALIKLLQDEKLWKHVSGRVRRLAEKRWKSENVASKLLTIYQQLLG